MIEKFPLNSSPNIPIHPRPARRLRHPLLRTHKLNTTVALKTTGSRHCNFLVAGVQSISLGSGHSGLGLAKAYIIPWACRRDRVMGVGVFENPRTVGLIFEVEGRVAHRLAWALTQKRERVMEAVGRESGRTTRLHSWVGRQWRQWCWTLLVRIPRRGLRGDGVAAMAREVPRGCHLADRCGRDLGYRRLWGVVGH